MPRPRPPYLQHEIDRHGNSRWYVRIRPHPRIRIRSPYGSPEFMAEYRAAIAGVEVEPHNKTQSGSLKWLIGQYRESISWRNLSATTRKQRDYVFADIIKKAGEKPYRAITNKVIAASHEARVATPAQASHFLLTLNGLFKWVLKAGHIKLNPVDGIEPFKRRKGSGIAPWTEEDVEKYQQHWPLGTKERVWLDVLLYTGLRRGDAVRLGRQHVRHGIATLKTEKSGFITEVTLPILPVLQRTLDNSPTGDLAFICDARGQPYNKLSFGHAFRKACRKADVKKSSHGVRKISATRAANAGATVAQLKALFGWTDNDMPSLYTQTADRRKLARDAIEKLALNSEG